MFPLDIQIAHKVKSCRNLSEDVRLNKKAAFSKMLLSEEVLKGITNSGFIYPTTIQASAIPMGKAGIDLIIQSKSGTGKTLIFSTIILENYHYEIPEPQALVLVPNREIALQIVDVINTIGKFCKGFRAVAVIGGLNFTDDRKRLQGAKVVVGTPGRVTHLIKNGILNTLQIKLFVLDEADKLYNVSFYHDLHYIQKVLPKKKQIIASSASLCDYLQKEMTLSMKNPILISNEDKTPILVGHKQHMLDFSHQKTSILEMKEKLNTLRQIFSQIPFKQCIAFANSQSRAESYCNNLQKEGWPCALITGSQIQKKRIETFYKFREFKMRILIATDVWSRGIDSNHIDLVINLDLPSDVVTYFHRIGRAGRFGSKGISIGFVCSESDHQLLNEIVTQYSGVINIYKILNKFEQNDVCPKNIKTNNCLHTKFNSDLLEIANEEIKVINENKNSEKISGDCNFSVGTKTFFTDSSKNAIKLLAIELNKTDLNLFLPNVIRSHESVKSFSHLLASSNTIDDASSIVADTHQNEDSYPEPNYCNFKNILQSYPQKPFKSADSEKNKSLAGAQLTNGSKKTIDIFDDFLSFMENDSKCKEFSNSENKTFTTLDISMQSYPNSIDVSKNIGQFPSKNEERTIDYCLSNKSKFQHKMKIIDEKFSKKCQTQLSRKSNSSKFTVAQSRWMNIYCKQIKLMHEYLNFV